MNMAVQWKSFEGFFDIINNDLLIVKFSRYGFDTESLKLIKSYLKNRLQRT